MQTHRVSQFTRAVLLLFLAFAVWQVYWLHRAALSVEAFIPAIQGVTWWQVAWTAVGLFSGVAAFTGWDLLARVALGWMAIVSTMGAITIWLSDIPMSREFYSFGQAALWAGSAFILLLAPLHTWPMHSGFPSDIHSGEPNVE